MAQRKKETLCWDCQKANCGCSWSRFYVPVKGWVATPTKIKVYDYCARGVLIDSYNVSSCPEFVKDKERIEVICPCDSCKHKIERKEGHRVFLECSDKEREKGFHYDDFFYHHTCDNYESEEEK